MTILWFVVGCVAGGVVAWLMGSTRVHRARASSEAQLAARDAEVAGLREGLGVRDRAIEEKVRELDAARTAGEAARLEAGRLMERLEAEQKAGEEKIRALVDVEKSLKTSFQALAADALDANSKRLMQLARGELETQQVEAAKELQAKESAIEMLLKPMQEQIPTQGRSCGAVKPLRNWPIIGQTAFQFVPKGNYHGREPRYQREGSPQDRRGFVKAAGRQLHALSQDP